MADQPGLGSQGAGCPRPEDGAFALTSLRSQKIDSPSAANFRVITMTPASAAFVGAAAAARTKCIGVLMFAARAVSLPGQADRTLADLRRPGGDRDRERAPVRRSAGAHARADGIAAAADRDRRHAQGHQPLAVRLQTGFRSADRVGGRTLRRQSRLDLRCAKATSFRSGAHPAPLPECPCNIAAVNPTRAGRGLSTSRASLPDKSRSFPEARKTRKCRCRGHRSVRISQHARRAAPARRRGRSAS